MIILMNYSDFYFIKHYTRFQYLTDDEQCDFMYCLYDTLNEKLFQNKLINVEIAIHDKITENIIDLFGGRGGKVSDEYAFYFRTFSDKLFSDDFSKDEEAEEFKKLLRNNNEFRTIVFTKKILEEFIYPLNETKQIEFLAFVLLHEMIHVYCDQYDIEDDGTHNKEWHKIASRHSLLINDKLGKRALMAIEGLKFNIIRSE